VPTPALDGGFTSSVMRAFDSMGWGGYGEGLGYVEAEPPGEEADASIGWPVLMYHGVHVRPGGEGHFDPVYSVDPGVFEAHLMALQALGLQSARLRDLSGAAPPKPVVITFDDGDASNYEVALPLLQAYGMVAEFFVVSDRVGRPGWLTAAQIRAIAEAGMGVQSHARSHRYLSDLSGPDLERELAESRHRLSLLSGQPVEALSLPGGRGGARELEAARAARYRHVLGSRPALNRRLDGPECLDRIAITRGLPLDEFRDLLRWRGAAPRVARFRYEALRLPKRVLGNAIYQRVRELVVSR
jgi:peptidoglycan/xylan/chitin deacetylase (PgdA/CDA1 family)